MDNKFTCLGTYINAVLEKSASAPSNLFNDSYINGLEESMGVCTEGRLKTASCALGREVFKDFSMRLFLGK